MTNKALVLGCRYGAWKGRHSFSRGLHTTVFQSEILLKMIPQNSRPLTDGMLLLYQLWYLCIHVGVFTELFKLLILDNFKKFCHSFPLKFNGLYGMDKWCIMQDIQLSFKQTYCTWFTKFPYKRQVPHKTKELPVVYVFTWKVSNNTHKGSNCKCLYNWNIPHESH